MKKAPQPQAPEAPENPQAQIQARYKIMEFDFIARTKNLVFVPTQIMGPMYSGALMAEDDIDNPQGLATHVLIPAAWLQFPKILVADRKYGFRVVRTEGEGEAINLCFEPLELPESSDVGIPSAEAAKIEDPAPEPS